MRRPAFVDPTQLGSDLDLEEFMNQINAIRAEADLKQGEGVRVQTSKPTRLTSEDVERALELSQSFGMTPEAIDNAIRAKYEPMMAQQEALRDSLDEVGPMNDLRYAQPLVTALGGRNLNVPGPQDTRLDELRKTAEQVGGLESERLQKQAEIFKTAASTLPRGQETMLLDMRQARPPSGLMSGNTLELKLEKEMGQEVGKLQSKFEEGNRALSGVKGALSTGNMQTIVSQLSNLARLSGEKGVLTDKDIGRQMYSSLGKIVKDVDAFFRGEFTADDFSIEQVNQISKILEDGLLKQYRKDRDNFEGRYKIRTGYQQARGPEFVKSLDDTYFRSYTPPKPKRSIMDAIGIKPAQPPKGSPTPQAPAKKKSLWEVLSK